MKNTVGLMLVVRQEEKRLAECLDWHLPYVDEVSICDQTSRDTTWDIINAYKRKSKIPFHRWQDTPRGFCEPSKQTTADLLQTDWILYVDPDEKFPIAFLELLHSFIEKEEYDGYTFPRNNIFQVQVYDDTVPIEPKWLTVQHPSRDYQLRLTRKSLSTFPPYLHHRVRVDGVTKSERIGIAGYSIDHIKTISEQWNDQKRYGMIKK